MKKRITRQRIAAILATAMLFWLPAGAMNEATPTDLTGGIKTSTVKIGGMTVILTTVEAQDKGARLPEVTGITNEKIIRAVEEAFLPKKAEAQHLLMKFGGSKGIKGKIRVEIQNAGLKKWKSAKEGKNTVDELVAEYNAGNGETTKNEAESRWNEDRVTFTIKGNTIIDLMLTAVPKKEGGSGDDQPQSPPDPAQPGDDPAQPGDEPAQPGDEPAQPGGGNETPTTDNRVGGTDPDQPDETGGIRAPDGSIYNPEADDDDEKVDARSASGTAQGPSFNIFDPPETDDDSDAGSDTPSAAAGATVAKSAEEEDASVGATASGTGYNVVLIGLKNGNTKSETWSLLMQKGIVFEDFLNGENVPADTKGLLMAGIEGIQKEDDSGYRNSSSAAVTSGKLISQFGFYGIMESDKKDTDAQVISDAADRLVNEGLVMNVRHIPFFMEVQLTGNSGDGDSLASLILEMEADGLGGNTVLLFALTDPEAEKAPLIMVHPAVPESMVIRTPVKAADVLATILALSGNADAAQYAVLNSMPGRNLLTMDEFAGREGLIPEPAEEEETDANGMEVPT